MRRRRILILMFLSCLLTFGQEQVKESDIYIYVDNNAFTSSVLGYKAYFFLESQEEDYNHDTYFFKIIFSDLDYHNLFELGKTIERESINYIMPISYFKGKSFCEMHLELSQYKRIYIVTDFPDAHKKRGKSYKNKFVVFYCRYYGSIKDITYTNMGNKKLIDL